MHRHRCVLVSISCQQDVSLIAYFWDFKSTARRCVFSQHVYIIIITSIINVYMGDPILPGTLGDQPARLGLVGECDCFLCPSSWPTNLNTNFFRSPSTILILSLITLRLLFSPPPQRAAHCRYVKSHHPCPAQCVCLSAS